MWSCAAVGGGDSARHSASRVAIFGIEAGLAMVSDNDVVANVRIVRIQAPLRTCVSRQLPFEQERGAAVDALGLIATKRSVLVR